MIVSATHDASPAATAASAAVPPSARISAPASAVAGCPAATAGAIIGRARRAGYRSARSRRAGSRLQAAVIAALHLEDRLADRQRDHLVTVRAEQQPFLGDSNLVALVGVLV